MSITDNLRLQHRELCELIPDISSRLDSLDTEDDANWISGLLLGLKEKIGFHLIREDQAFYPALLRHPDERITSLARQYVEEMGSLSKEFTSFMSRWPNAIAIQEKSVEFVPAARELFAALVRRIDREDNELYPLLDTE